MMMAATALVLAGCSNDENEGMDNWNGEIRLSSGLVVQTRANSTDVPDRQIANGEMIGIYVKPVDGDTGYGGYSNFNATANGQGGFTNYKEPMYYSTSNPQVLISAYHPYNDANTDEYNFTVETNQSVESNYFKSDLLYSKEETYNRQIAAHSLTFVHKLVKVVCTLESGYGNPDIEEATVEIVEPERAVKFNRTTGKVDKVDESVKDQDVKLGKYGAIIAPQDYTEGSRFLKVTLKTENNPEFYYTNPDEKLEWSSGNVYKYNIQVYLSGLTVKSEITPWTPVNEVSGSATME